MADTKNTCTNKKHDLAFVRVIDKVRVPEKYHRGKKLMEEDKEEIRRLYKTGEYSYRELALLYKVSYSSIQVTIDENRRLKNLELARKYQERNPDKVKERRKGRAMELRYYKKRLIQDGKIDLKK